MKVVYSPEVLEFHAPHHPESPQRVLDIYQKLQEEKGFEFVAPTPALETDLMLVHTKELLQQVKNNTFFDFDTPNYTNIYHYALISVGSAIKSSEIALEEKYAFSLSRPPGHHATKTKVGGFCYFNNIAVATAKLTKKGKKVAILDIDVHHGNGTQDIFLGQKNVLFCSIHQSPFYPGTGLKSCKNCLNFPIPSGVGFLNYQKKLEKACGQIDKYQADILGVSLGFDTYRFDNLANINLGKNDYKSIGKTINKLDLPTFFVLEGGYSRDIGKLASEFFAGLLQD